MSDKLDRPILQSLINMINNKYHDVKNQMSKQGATQDQLNRLMSARDAHENKLRKAYGDNLQQLNLGDSVQISGGTKLGELPQKGLPDMSKQPLLNKEGMFKKIKSAPSMKAVKGLALGSMLMGLLNENASASDKALDVAEVADPSGLIGAGREVKRRLDMTPEQGQAQHKEDIGQQLDTLGIGDEFRQLKELEESDTMNHRNDDVYSEKQRKNKEPLDVKSERLKNLVNIFK